MLSHPRADPPTFSLSFSRLRLSKHAFHRVLSAKQTKFAPVVKALHAELAQGPNPCAAAGLEAWETVVEHAWEGVKGVIY